MFISRRGRRLLTTRVLTVNARSRLFRLPYPFPRRCHSERAVVTRDTATRGIFPVTAISHNGSKVAAIARLPATFFKSARE
jgi:hypothetical protein